MQLQDETPTTQVGQGNYAPVNGLNLYYEIHGEGQPLVVLPGGFATIAMIGQILPTLAQNHQVIAVEFQGHGHTADIERSFSYETFADDVAALLDYLNISQADFMGYSLGGGVALQAAIRHPEKVGKLVLVSTPIKHTGWYTEVLNGMSALSAESASFMHETPMYLAYKDVAPRLENWPQLVSKTGQLLSQDYDWTDAVKSLKAPALIVIGDGDSVRLSHAVEMFSLFGGGQGDGMMSGRPLAQFAVLPDTLHWNILFNPNVVAVVEPFLAATQNQK